MSQAELKARLTLNDSGFQSGLRQASLHAEKFAGGIRAKLGPALATPLAGLGGALAASLSGGAFARGIVNATKLGGELHDLSQSSGVAVGQLYSLKSAFEDSDKSTGDIASSLARMQKAVAGGGEKFAGLGIEISKLQTMQPAQQFQSIARGILAIENPAQRTAAAMEIFGKSGASLIPVFQNVANVDLTKLSKAGAILEANAKAMDNLGDSAGQAKRNIDALFIGFTAGSSKGLQGLLDNVNDRDFSNTGTRLGTLFGNALQGAADIGKRLKPIMPFAGVVDHFAQPDPEKVKTIKDTLPPDVNVQSGSGWGKLETFKSFADPNFNKANSPQPNISGKPVDNLMGSEKFGSFFHPGMVEGRKLEPLGGYSSLTTMGPAGMSAAYHDKDMLAPKGADSPGGSKTEIPGMDALAKAIEAATNALQQMNSE